LEYHGITLTFTNKVVEKNTTQMT